MNSSIDSICESVDALAVSQSTPKKRASTAAERRGGSRASFSSRRRKRTPQSASTAEAERPLSPPTESDALASIVKASRLRRGRSSVPSGVGSSSSLPFAASPPGAGLFDHTRLPDLASASRARASSNDELGSLTGTEVRLGNGAGARISWE